MKDKKKYLRILTDFLWCICLGLCVLIAYTTLNYVSELIICITIIVLFVLAIVCSVKLKKYRNKTKNSMRIVDGNVLLGRKLYKGVLRKFFKQYVILTLLGTTILCVPTIIYFVINFDLFMIIVASVTMVVFPPLVLSIIYPLIKAIHFPYNEITFNGDTFVLFLEKETIRRYVSDPCFHVVYKEQEYVQKARETWMGFSSGVSELGANLLLRGAMDLLDWFNNEKFTNYLKIDIDSERSGKVQCICKLGTNQLIVTDQFETLKGFFEKSISQVKEKKKGSK